MPKQYKILGLGAACIDLLIPIDESFLKFVPGKKGGAQPIDLETLHQIIQKNGIPPRISIGGSCANVIKGLSHLDVDCGLISAIGSDTYGDHFTQTMQKLGIKTLFKPSQQPTTLVLCLITPDGQRTMRFFPGSSQDMHENLLVPSHFKGVKIVHIDSYTLANGNLVKKLMQLAKDNDVKISLDLSSFEIVKEYSDLIHELLTTYVDIVFANIDETKALTGLNPSKGCAKLQKMCPTVVVLAGKDGCFVGHKGKIISSPAFPAEAIDSTGAGDLFASGFLYGYLHNKSLETCARLGNYLGGAITEITGTELSEERWQGIKNMIHHID